LRPQCATSCNDREGGYLLPLAQAARTRLYAMFDKRLRHIPTPQFHTSVLQAIDKDNIAKIN
jgi:hypothetical protein